MAMRLDLGHLLSELLLPLSPGGRKSLCLQVSEDTSFMLFLEWGKSPPPTQASSPANARCSLVWVGVPAVPLPLCSSGWVSYTLHPVLHIQRDSIYLSMWLRGLPGTRQVFNKHWLWSLVFKPKKKKKREKPASPSPPAVPLLVLVLALSLSLSNK